jgi:outer membrane protein assembly factor BamB
LEEIRRYYNGVTERRTTICCSAFALTIVSLVASLAAQTPSKPAAPIAFKTKWTIPLGGSLTAPPSFNGARGYFPVDDRRLVAYDLTLGSDLWTVKGDVRSQPAAGDGLVFYADEGALIAVNDETGAAAWRAPFSETLASSLVWDNGWLIAATGSNAVVAFRASDGKMIWTRDLGSPAKSRPALAADRVYIATVDERVVALQIETGSPLWERRIRGPLNDMLALDDRLYIGSNDNYLYCLKTNDGLVDWRWPTGADVRGQPVADDRTVYFVSFDNLLRALDRRSGNQRWKRPLPLRPTNGPVRAGDALIVSGIAPMLRAYFTKDGAPAGDVATDGELAAAPYYLDDLESAAVIVVTRHIAKGAILSALSRAAPPAAAPAAQPANPEQPAPTPVLPVPPTPGA